MTLFIIFTVLTLFTTYGIIQHLHLIIGNTELNKCLYLDAKQLAISELVEYPSIDNAILMVRPLILEISFQNDFLFEPRKVFTHIILTLHYRFTSFMILTSRTLPPIINKPS